MDVLYSNKDSILARIEKIMDELDDIKRELMKCDIIEVAKNQPDYKSFLDDMQNDDISKRTDEAGKKDKKNSSKQPIQDSYGDYDSISILPNIEL